MRPILALALAAVLSIGLMGNSCDDGRPPPTAQQRQADAARQAAAAIDFTDNAEIENIQKRIQLTSKPGLLGFIILLNESGQPIMYEGVKGKVTSGGKRLTPPSKLWSFISGNGGAVLGPTPSDEGTWGTSGEYIFYWNTNGEYRQWAGKYLYSDKPFRLRVEPLVVTAEIK